MAQIKTSHIICPQCNQEVEASAKRNSFTTNITYTCPNCGFKGPQPLSISTQIWYWTSVVCVIVLLYYASQGYSIRLGYLALFVPFWLFQDWRLRKNISEYREEHGLPPYVEAVGRNEVLKGILCSVVIIAIAFVFSPWISSLSASTPSASDWQPYHSIDGQFTVDFPGTPTVNNAPFSIPGYTGSALSSTTYEVDTNSESYFAAYTRYPDDLPITDHKTSLEGVVNGSVNNVESGQLITSNYITVNGNPAVDYEIFSSKENVYVKARAIERGQNVYIMTISSTLESPADYDQMVNSFTLTQ